MILVTGATGKIGSALISFLQQSKLPTRALVRDVTKAKLPEGVEAVVADLNDASTLPAAFVGIDKLFLLAPGFNIPQQEKDLIEAAKNAGVKRIVMVSSLGVDSGSGSGPLHVPGEALLQSSTISWTLLRPMAFMSNSFQWAQTIKTQGTFYEPTGQGAYAMIDPKDIAEVAFKALTQSGHDKKIYSLTGPKALRSSEYASILSEVLGRPITHVDLPTEAFQSQLESFGMPPMVLQPVMRFYTLIKQGELSSLVTKEVEAVLGRPARDFSLWARENAAAFQA